MAESEVPEGSPLSIRDKAEIDGVPLILRGKLPIIFNANADDFCGFGRDGQR